MAARKAELEFLDFSHRASDSDLKLLDKFNDPRTWNTFSDGKFLKSIESIRDNFTLAVHRMASYMPVTEFMCSFEDLMIDQKMRAPSKSKFIIMKEFLMESAELTQAVDRVLTKKCGETQAEVMKFV